MTLRCQTRQFTWNGATKSFVAEASDFNDQPNAAITEVHLTGQQNKTVRYYLARTETREGDILYWMYRPLTEDVVAVPKAAGTKVIIYND